jgi:hypothetical protein
MSQQTATQHDHLSRLPPVRTVAFAAGDDLRALIRAGQPALITGLIEQWPCLHAARRSSAALNDYFKALDRGAPVPVKEAPASSEGRFGYQADLREFTFSTRQRPLGETLDRLERGLERPGGAFIAIQMLPLNLLPGFLPTNPMPLLPGVEPRLWLGGPVRTQLHHDRDHNLACVIAGRRRFVLFPPEQVGNLYVGPIDNPPPLSVVDVEAPDLERFPKFAQALLHAHCAQLAPGDALFIPRHWWHHVTSCDAYNAMINYWWGAYPAGLENPYDCFLTALLALKDLPVEERIYWQAMFQTYVFKVQGSALQHIPQDLQGVLGDMPAAVRASLKQKLKAVFLKS